MKSIKRGLWLYFLLINFFSNAQVVWQARANFAGTARNHAIGFSYGDKGYIVTGGHNNTQFKDFWEYNSLTDSWTQLPDYPGVVRSYGIGAVIGDKAYIGFGHSGNTYLTDWWEYDFTNSTWTQKNNFPGPGRDHPTCASMNGKLYVGFGDDDNGNYKDWWQYDPENDSWVLKANFPGFTMHHPVSSSHNDIVYIHQGHVETATLNYPSKKLYAYNTLTDTWTIKADMPGPGSVAGAAFALGDKLYSGIGIEEPVETFHNEFYEYTISTNTWTSIANYPGTGWFAPVSFVIGNDGYVITGMNQMGTDTKNLYRLHDTSSAGIEEKELNSLKLFPNPASNYVEIESGDLKTTIEIYTIGGSLIETFQKNSQKIKIDLTDFESGLYYIKSDHAYIKMIVE